MFFLSMQKDKNRKRVIKLIRVFKKRKKNKRKTVIEEREQKRLVFKNT